MELEEAIVVALVEKDGLEQPFQLNKRSELEVLLENLSFALQWRMLVNVSPF